MPDREKVMKGLECCALGSLRNCEGCPYTETRCSEHLCGDALALLKEQEPRVMTEDDVLHSTGKPLWFESRGPCLCGKKGFWCLLFEVDPDLNIRCVQAMTGGSITLPLSYYGKEWRSWDKCPSTEQMRDTPWEGEKDA